MNKKILKIFTSVIALSILIGLPSAAYSQIAFPNRGGTGTSTIPTAGQVLVGQTNGTYGPQATSSLGFGTGTVSSVGLSVPVGFSIAGSPVTSAGTLVLTFAPGYEGLKTASSSQWNASYASTTALTPDYIRALLSALAPLSYNSSTGQFSLGTVDISSNTNLAVGSPITLTGDTLGFDFGTTNTWSGGNTFGNSTSSNHFANLLRFTNASGTNQTVTGNLYLSALSDGCLEKAGGVVTSTGSNCGTGGGGITNLNGQTGSSQTFATGSASGIYPSISSAGNVHTFSPALSPSYSTTTVTAIIVNGDTLNDVTGTGLGITGGTLNVTLAAFSTSDLAEGSNQYFTNARADARIAAATTTIRFMLGSSTPITYDRSTGVFGFDFSTNNTWSGRNVFDNSSSTNQTISNILYTPGMANGCLQVASGIATSTGINCSTGGSGNSAFTIGNGLIHNATSTDLVGIGTSTPYATFTVQGKGGVNPLSIASSTGAQMITLLQNGNFGIGSSTAASKLVVYDPSNAMQAQFGDDPAVIAIGTPATQGAFVGGYASASGGLSTIYFGNNLYWNGSTWVHPNTSANAGAFIQQNGSFVWYTAPPGASGLGTARMSLGSTGDFVVDAVDNPLFVSSANNRVGIKTNNPLYPLDVVASSTQSFPQTLIGFRNPGNGDWGLTLGNEAVPNVYIGVAGSIATSSFYTRHNWNTAGVAANTYRAALNSDNALTVANFERARSGNTGDYITATTFGGTMGDVFKVGGTGNVGIGTSTPAQALSIAGNMRLTGAFFDTTNASGTSGMVLQTTGTGVQWVATSSLGITGGSGSGNSAFTIGNGSIYNATSTDLVGIGSSTPTATLSIKGKGGVNPFIVASSSDATMLVVNQLGTTTIATLGAVNCDVKAENGNLYCGTDASGSSTGNAAFTIGNAVIYNATSTDNVGIGTTTPGKLLHVYGSQTGGIMKIERVGAITTQAAGTQIIKLKSTSDVVAGGGPTQTFMMEDTANVENTIGDIGFVRSDADNTGAFRVRPYVLGGATWMGLQIDAATKSASIGTTSIGATVGIVGTSSASTLATLRTASSTGDTTFTVNADGKVGVGTTSPIALFSVNGTSTASCFATNANSTVCIRDSRDQPVVAITLNTLNDATPYYFGCNPSVAPSAAGGNFRCKFPVSGTIVEVSINGHCTTPGDNAAWPMLLRLNDTTDYTIESLSSTDGVRYWSNANMAVPYTVGDFYEIKSNNPTWVTTNPAQCRWSGYVKLQR